MIILLLLFVQENIKSKKTPTSILWEFFIYKEAIKVAKELLYYIPTGQYGKEGVLSLLEQHPEIKFVSLVGIDLAGNDTDEKIPISQFFKDYESFFEGRAVQTDGSSVVLTDIATLNNARIDIWADPGVNWIVDYNYENIDEETGLPTGTLRIPSFLYHNYRYVDSRSILKRTQKYVSDELLKLLKGRTIPGMEHINFDEIDELVFTTATELEFWVKSPSRDIKLRELSASQKMQEQYWQRTHGVVRTAMEQSVKALDLYGLEPEMGHKEVGGVKASIDESGNLKAVVEQLEIDWKYNSNPLQTADNELLARILVREVFRENGLEVTYLAKPIIGVAGSGEHTHWGIIAKMKDGSVVNLFSPEDQTKSFLSPIGVGAIMGLLKNYEAINPFISSTTDSLNRLKPGFEAPVCIVTSLGQAPDFPGRNRTILCGLIRDIENPMATRFELRSPNPFTNTYTAISLIYLAALDGMRYAIESGKDEDALVAELSKKAGEEAAYLEKDREYRSEEDVFDFYTQEERDALYGKPPKTVWENIKGFYSHPKQVEVLTQGDAFSKDLMESFLAGVKKRWSLELTSRIIPKNLGMIKRMVAKHDVSEAYDASKWSEIQELRTYLAKNTMNRTSLFTRICNAVEAKDYDLASDLQIEMNEKMLLIEELYANYVNNIL